jgi:quaternary ammonium compound-resistance protein SugE
MTPTLAWLALVASGLVDVAWAPAMKKAGGFANPAVVGNLPRAPGRLRVPADQALQVLPVGTAYAVWTGIGAAGTVVAGIVLFAERASALRLFFIATVVLGIVGLKVAS